MMQETADEIETRDAEAAAKAPIPDLLQGDAHNLINVILARTRALRQASLAARKMTSGMPEVSLLLTLTIITMSTVWLPVCLWNTCPW